MPPSDLSVFPNLWKVSQIIMIHKPGKPPHRCSFCTVIEEYDVVPIHQFGFRKQFFWLSDCHNWTNCGNHRIYHTIRQCFENKKYCFATFLDIQQAFDRVWHRGLLPKTKENCLTPYFSFWSPNSNRLFQVKHGGARSTLYPIEAGVPQGSVLGPVLHNIYNTSDYTLAHLLITKHSKLN